MARRSPVTAKYVSILAAASALILLVGALFRPQTEGEPSLPPASETDISRLTRLTQRRSLETLTAYLSSVADDVAHHVVRVRAIDASGVAWDEAGLIATVRPDRVLPQDLAIVSAAGETSAVAFDWAPDLTVAGARMTGTPAVPPVRRSGATRDAGDWLVAVWKSPEGARVFAPANFLQTSQLDCGAAAGREVLSTLTFTRVMAGGGLFDMDGSLVGLILPCGDRYAAVAPDTVDQLLRETRSLPSRLLAKYGLVVAPLTQDEVQYFGATGEGSSGLLVREVLLGSIGDSRGLNPGDIIVGVNAAPVSGMNDLQPLVDSDGVPPEMEVVRDGKRVPVTLGGAARDARPEDSRVSSSGLEWERPTDGFRIDAVQADSVAARAGLRVGDRLQRVGRVAPRNLEQVRRLLEGRPADPTFLVLERADRRMGALLKREEP